MLGILFGASISVLVVVVYFMVKKMRGAQTLPRVQHAKFGAAELLPLEGKRNHLISTYAPQSGHEQARLIGGLTLTLTHTPAPAPAPSPPPPP